MAEGWIKLYRKITEHAFFQEKRTFSRFEAWLYFILQANHADNKILFGNEIIEIKRGSFITSKRKLCERFKWSNTKLDKFLNLLEFEKMIAQNSDTKKTVLTLINYDFYNNPNDTETEQKRHDNGTTTAQKRTNKNDKNDKNVKKKDSSLSAVKTLIDFYHDSFVKKFGEKPVIDGKKDGAIIKGLLGTYSEEKLKGLIGAFFESTDQFIVNSGYTIGVFKTQINKLISTGGKGGQAHANHGSGDRPTVSKNVYKSKRYAGLIDESPETDLPEVQ